MNTHETELIPLPGGSVAVRWKISKRARRVSMRPDPQYSGLLITLPGQKSRPVALHLLVQNTQWVYRVLAAARPALRFLPGETLLLDGISVTIEARPHARGGAGLDGNIPWVSGQESFHSRRIMSFLRTRAEHTLPACVKTEALRTGLMPSTVSVRDPASRWGSCSSARRIMLSWRLTLAPASVRDYVILHELAHLNHLNHSREFWALVDRITPDRKQAELWLKQNGQSLLNAGRNSSVPDA